MSRRRSLRPEESARAGRFGAGALLALAFALFFCGCAAPLRKPEVSVAGVEFVELGVVEQTLLLRLRVINPNDVELTVNSLSFALDVNARTFAHGGSTSAARLPPNGDAVFEIRTVTRLGEVIRLLREARRGDAPLAYLLAGYIDVAGYGQLPFSRRAELPGSIFDRFLSR